MTSIVLPNVRKLFIPDPGYTMFEADLSGADAQVVAWEAEDEDLKSAFRAGIDVHGKNAEDMWGAAFSQLVGEARYKKRQSCKHAVHGTNYGGSPHAIARHPAINWTVHEADQFQKRWFSIHPGIKDKFQGGVDRAIKTNRTVQNRFGFRRTFFGRIEDSYTEGLAWIPQSTVALTTFLGWFSLEEKFPQAEILLQVHDSVVFQIPTDKVPPARDVRKALEVVIPYSDPLIIPWGLSASTKSWGDCQKIEE